METTLTKVKIRLEKLDMLRQGELDALHSRTLKERKLQVDFQGLLIHLWMAANDWRITNIVSVFKMVVKLWSTYRPLSLLMHEFFKERLVNNINWNGMVTD